MSKTSWFRRGWQLLATSKPCGLSEITFTALTTLSWKLFISTNHQRLNCVKAPHTVALFFLFGSIVVFQLLWCYRLIIIKQYYVFIPIRNLLFKSICVWVSDIHSKIISPLKAVCQNPAYFFLETYSRLSSPTHVLKRWQKSDEANT